MTNVFGEIGDNQNSSKKVLAWQESQRKTPKNETGKKKLINIKQYYAANFRGMFYYKVYNQYGYG